MQHISCPCIEDAVFLPVVHPHVLVVGNLGRKQTTKEDKKI